MGKEGPREGPGGGLGKGSSFEKRGVGERGQSGCGEALPKRMRERRHQGIGAKLNRSVGNGMGAHSLAL